MEKNEIKKILYKFPQKANLVNIRKDGILYTTFISDISSEGDFSRTVTFLIPLGEIGEVIWEKQMDAKLLIRWLQD